jgi:MFS transporter, MHS family, proline/betaine transporter
MKSIKPLLAAICGNILEWYDFMIYAALAPIIANIFFPAKNSTSALIATFGAFATGFLIRPLGGLLIGYIGDRYSRRQALILSVVLMAVPTFLMGCLPTYERIGLIAPIVLIVLRMIQGLSVGGELPGVIIYLVEHAKESHRALNGSFAIIGISLGLFIGSFVANNVIHLMSSESLLAYGWRLPFIFGLVLAVPAIILRYQNLGKNELKPPVDFSPWRLTFQHHKKQMLIVMGLQLLPAIGFNIIFIFMSSYLTHFLNKPIAFASSINIMSIILFTLLVPLFSMLSDKVGRKPLLFTASLLFIIFSCPLFLILSYASNALVVFAVICLVVMMASYFGGVTAMMVELFSTKLRYTPIAIAHGLTFAIFAGTSPLVSTFLIRWSGLVYSPCFYIMVAASIVFTMLFFLAETYKIRS